jgi:hypothetical protein
MNFEPKNETDPTHPPITEEIARRLGEAGIGEYEHLPRKTKKAVIKNAQGRGLNSREQSRLAALKNRENNQ